MISRQLDLIIEQFNNLDKQKGKIPQIDLDIMKRNVSILYEQLFELERENTTSLFDKKDAVKAETAKAVAEKEAIEEAPIAKIIEEPIILKEELEEEMTFPVDLTPDPVIEEPEPPKTIETIKEPVMEELFFEEKTIINKVQEPIIIEEPISEPEPTPVFEEETIEVTENTTITFEETPIFTEENKVIEEPPAIVVEEAPIVNAEPELPEEPFDNIPPIHVEKPIEHTEEKHTDLFGGSHATIADKYKKETKTVIDRLHIETANKTIGTKHQHHAIKDLKSAIGINEKFLFINELFRGDMKAFNDVIIKLNEYTDINDADNLLNELKEKYNWAEDLVAFLTLKDFVIRKFL